MSKMQKDASVHTVKIQQTYWVKDTSEEKMMAMGAVHLGRMVEQVDYYDTDLYDLAIHQTWLSRIGKQWQLIVGRGQNTSKDPSKKKVEKSHQGTQKGKTVDNKAKNPKTSVNQKEDPKTDHNGNEESEDPVGTTRKTHTCYTPVEENEIVTHLSQVLHLTNKIDNTPLEGFLQKAGIQKYASISNITQETFRLRNDYTIQLKTEGTATKKTAVVSLNVDIEKVTQGFERLDQLANELDLQLQNV
ncbi:uncharacterized protein [Hyperolius riggenbachi]|uniref:uncharacterized protein n=1 Tax=Hyperolius riggenbachi TaxID=752182 RepID=UPI0035A37A37